MNSADREQVVRELFELPLSAEVVHSFRQRAFDEHYWKSLNPHLSIGGPAAEEFEAQPLTSADVAELQQRFDREGFFQTAPVLRTDLLHGLCAAIERLRAERWPPVFAFVYDEFWRIVRTPSLVALLSSLLGQGFTQNSIVWVFYVSPSPGARGWSPHVDASGDPPRMTVWVPLTDATVENGCIYVMPADRFAGDLRRQYFAPENVTKAELRRLLQCTRALPSPRGAYLGWNHELLHWGSVSDGNSGPRVAVGLEFIGPNVTPIPSELPLLDPLGPLPTFTDRLKAIGSGMFAYQRYEPSYRRYAELARLLFESNGA